MPIFHELSKLVCFFRIGNIAPRLVNMRILFLDIVHY